MGQYLDDVHVLAIQLPSVVRSRFGLGSQIRSRGTLMDQIPDEVTHLIDRLRAGDRQALGELFHGYRERLRRMVELRMDSRLRTRLDASDVLQEAYLDLAGDLEAYRADPKLPPLLWMRLHVGRRLT